MGKAADRAGKRASAKAATRTAAKAAGKAATRAGDEATDEVAHEAADTAGDEAGDTVGDEAVAEAGDPAAARRRDGAGHDTRSEGDPLVGSPTHWDAEVLLRDGSAGRLRPIRDDDAGRLRAFFDEVSEESRYFRFFSAMPNLSDRDVQRMVGVDHRSRVALVLTLGEEMLALAQLERPDEEAAEAEVAFLVQDRHQHRGIGQLLLEHLAQVAREVGAERLVAHILPDNTGMQQMFRDAGYHVSGGYEDGMLTLQLELDPTHTSAEVMAAREHRAERVSVERILSARSVAVVGASRRTDTVGQLLVRNLVTGGYTGRVYVVNPAADAVAGMPAYDSVADIPDQVDIAVVAVAADSVADVVLDCARKGVHGLVVVSSGFAETGTEGRRLQRQLVKLCRSYGLRLVGPNALGIINTAPGLAVNASLSPVLPPRGRAGFFCQSGALGVAILENVARRGLGLSTFVSAGNRADVSGNDLLQYWEDDDATELVLLYLESIGNPRKFSRIARRVSRRKPVIAVKSGRATQGVPMGHSVRPSETGRETIDAMFRQAGVIQVDTLDEMFDVAQLLAHQPLPRGNRVAVVGNSDALALLASDAAVAAGLETVPVEGLRPDATAESFEAALDRALDDPEVDAVLAVFLPPVNTTGTEVADVLAVVGEQSDKPVVSSFLASEGLPELLRVPDAAGSTAGRGSVPSYSSTEAAVRALACAVEYAAWLRRPEQAPVETAAGDLPRARSVVSAVLAGDPEGRELTEEELIELLAAYDIDLWRRIQVTSQEEAVAAGEELGWHVVLKATADHLRQRPDLAHVWRNIDGEEEMVDAWETMHALVESRETAEFVVQRCAAPGVPTTLRGLEDPLFGPVVSFGVSGPATELLGDRAYRIPPMGALDAAEMVQDIRAAPMLLGYRGSEPVDLSALEWLLLRLAQLKNDLPEVREVNLPLVVASSVGATVLTGSARVEPATDARSHWYARRMTSAAETQAG